MLKKIKSNKKLIIGVAIGILISVTTSYTLAETLIKSADVSYVDNSKLGATNVQAAIDGTCTKFSNELSNFLNKIYPVGSIYISTANTNPSTFLGGTWENYADGRVLKGIKSGTAGATGGSSSVTLSTANLPAHTHTYDKANANTGSHTLTIAEMPSHTHKFDLGGNALVVDAETSVDKPSLGFMMIENSTWSGHNRNASPISAIGGDQGHTHPISTTSVNTGSTGSATPTAINVQDPYITVYMWRRTK